MAPAAGAGDPFTDSDAVGLGKFNIGLVPASVTPPRTWRRAAWFAVLSSAAVLVGLALAAAKLVGSSDPVERIGLPGYPTDVPLLPRFPTTTAPTPAAPEPDIPGPVLAGEPERAQAPGADTRGTAEAGGSATPHPTPADTAAPTASPEVITVSHTSEAVVDGMTIATRTEQFYEQAATSTDTAMALVSDSFRSNAEALLEQRFADVSLVEVTTIRVDPARGVTVSTLWVTRKDGTRLTEERELVFTTTGDPRIDAERPAEGV